MVRSHYGVLEEHELRTTTELLYLSQGSRRGSGSSDGNNSWKFKLIFGSVLSILTSFARHFTKIVMKLFFKN